MKQNENVIYPSQFIGVYTIKEQLGTTTSIKYICVDSLPSSLSLKTILSPTYGAQWFAATSI